VVVRGITGMEDDPEASVILGQPGVVLDSAQPRDDGTGWRLGVWMSAPEEVWGFDENDLDVIPTDGCMVAAAGLDAGRIGSPWRDEIVFDFGTGIWQPAEANSKIEPLASAIRSYLPDMEIALRVPKRFDEPIIASLVAFAREDAAEELRDLLSDATFGRWTVDADDGWSASLLWHPPTLAGLGDTEWITLMTAEVLPWEHPGKRSWRFADAIR
jgi:hypothetical protein